jgi:uncharacterized membrane protein
MNTLSNNQFTTSLWGDEGFSAILSMKSLPEIIKIIVNDTSPPLWNITEWIVFNTLGTDEIYIRGLAFTYFLLAVFFVYKIGVLLWNRKTGIIAAILTFLNPFFFSFAFEGRMYSILALGVTASMYFFLKMACSKKVTRKDAVGYVIATLWALYSHHFAIFAVFLQGMLFLFEFFFGKRKTAVSIFKLFIVVGIGYLPWIIPLYNQTKMVGGGFWLGTPNIEDLGGLILEYLAAGIRNENLTIPLLNLPFYKASMFVVIFALIIRNWTKEVKNTTFILIWFLGPILLTWIVSQIFQSIFFNRYLLYTIPAAMIIAASNQKRIISSILLTLTISMFIIIDYHYFTHPIKRPFKQLASYVKQTRREGDFLINWNAASHHLWESKYYDIYGPIYVPEKDELPFFVGTALMKKNDVIHKLPENIKRVGVITSGSVEDVNLDGYTVSEVKKLRDLNFVWYVPE